MSYQQSRSSSSSTSSSTASSSSHASSSTATSNSAVAAEVNRSAAEEEEQGLLDWAWDTATGAASSAVDSVMDWGAEQIASVDDLVYYIETVGEDAARTVVESLAAVRPALIVGLLFAMPGLGVAVGALALVDSSVVRDMFDEMEPHQITGVLAKAAALGLFGPVAAPLMLLDSEKVGAVLAELDEDTVARFWDLFKAEMKEQAVEHLADLWPVGMGLRIEENLGATFGYPIYLGQEAHFELVHSDAEVFQLKRGGVLIEAFDTGVGAGAFIGLGGDKSGEGGIGIGAEAGAEFMAGLKQILEQEFEFPIFEDFATFGAFVMTVTFNDALGSAFGVLGEFEPELKKLDPMSYNTKTKIEGRGFAEGNAMAQAGVRMGGENTKQGEVQTWRQNEGKPDTGTTNYNSGGEDGPSTADKAVSWSMRNLLTASIFGNIKLEGGIGGEVRNKDFFNDPVHGRRPKKVELDLYGEGEAGLNIVHSIPVLSDYIPQLPGGNFAGGVRTTFYLDLTEADAPALEDHTFSVYGKDGDNETAIEVRAFDDDTFASVDGLIASLKAVHFKRKLSLGGDFGRKYVGMAARQPNFRVMLPSEYQAAGLSIEGGLQLETELSPEMVKRVFEAIVAVYEEYASGEGLQGLYDDFLAFVGSGDVPDHLLVALEEIADAALAGLKKLELQGHVGVRAAAGGQVGGGAKVRLDGGAAILITVAKDIVPDIGGSDGIQVDDLQQLFGGGDSGTDTLEVPALDGAVA